MSINGKLTLFGRLYLFIIVAITCAIYITKLIIDDYYNADDFVYFSGASQHLHQHIHENKKNNVVLNKEGYQVIALPSPYDQVFAAAWVDKNLTVEKICKNCRYLEDVGYGEFYRVGDDNSLVLFDIAGGDENIVITDEDDLLIEMLEIQNDLFDEFILYWLIAIVSIFVGLTIYWPLSKLQQQITGLISSHHRFGDGNFQERANIHLDRPLDELAVSFNAMAGSIETSVKESEVFAQAIPHELRTPLSRMQLAFGLLRKSQNEEQRRELLDDVERYIDDVNELIKQIVSLTKLKTFIGTSGNHPEEVHEVEPLDLAEYIAARVEWLNVDAGVSVLVESTDDTLIDSNPIFLRLLLDNIIKNAVNHARSRVRISVKTLPASICIHIEDDGSGIAEKDRDYVFIPFARLDSSRSRKTGGMGLGLAIAQAAAKNLSGVVDICDAEIGGACFKICLPLRGQ